MKSDQDAIELGARPGDGVGDALEGRRNGDDFLDGPAKTLDVVIPVEDLPDVKVLQKMKMASVFI